MNKGSLKHPVTIRLRHRRPIFEEPLWQGAAKILHEAIKRRFDQQIVASHDFTVMIPRNSEDGRVIILIWFIKLCDILAAFATQIDDVSKVEKKSRSFSLIRIGNLLLHGRSDRVLRFIAMNSPGVAERVKHQSARLFQLAGHAGKNGFQSKIETRSAERRWGLETGLLGKIRDRIADFGRDLCED